MQGPGEWKVQMPDRSGEPTNKVNYGKHVYSLFNAVDTGPSPKCKISLYINHLILTL